MTPFISNAWRESASSEIISTTTWYQLEIHSTANLMTTISAEIPVDVTITFTDFFTNPTCSDTSKCMKLMYADKCMLNVFYDFFKLCYVENNNVGSMHKLVHDICTHISSLHQEYKPQCRQIIYNLDELYTKYICIITGIPYNSAL